MKYLSIQGKRSNYAPIDKTLTVKELLRYLQYNIKSGILDENMPIYLSNDNGYTYGTINKDMEIMDYNKDTQDYTFIDDLLEDF